MPLQRMESSEASGVVECFIMHVLGFSLYMSKILVIRIRGEGVSISRYVAQVLRAA